MSIYRTEISTLSESSTSSTEPLGQALISWALIKLDDELNENEARAQIQKQVQSLIQSIPFPWRTVELTPHPVETVVIDVMQQELDNGRYLDGYRTAYMKCLQALCKARNIVPSSLFLRDVTREGENPVGGGGFADIWTGRLCDADVCLKVLRVFCPEEQKAKALRDFCQEALVWRQLRHPNVLPFLGVSEDLFAPRYCLISPWIVNGNIMSYLEAHPDHDRLTSLVQIAEGMEYLHNLSPPIVHADIRGANILVMDDLRCCLADFGLSLFAESQTLDSTSRMSKGSTRWLAPEYIDPNAVIDRAYITARDIYAYGCTVVEIFTGKPPFSNIKIEPAVMLAVIAGKRPVRPQQLLQDGLWSLVTMCLITSPRQRPTAGYIAEFLKNGEIATSILPAVDSRDTTKVFPKSFCSIYSNAPVLRAGCSYGLERSSSQGSTLVLLDGIGCRFCQCQMTASCRRNSHDVHDLIPTSFLLKEPPGTGKTTARKMELVYSEMGSLSRRGVLEYSADIIAQYVGQTGALVRKKFDNALGQVLFIGEAYRLKDGVFKEMLRYAL